MLISQYKILKRALHMSVYGKSSMSKKLSFDKILCM